MANYTPEKSKQIALARLDLIHKWLEFRKKSTNKLQADYDFVKLHNTSSSHLFENIPWQFAPLVCDVKRNRRLY